MISSATSPITRASARSTPCAATNLAMALRFTSWVRPERISSPMISAAAVTRPTGCMEPLPRLLPCAALSRSPMDFPQPLVRGRLIQRKWRLRALSYESHQQQDQPHHTGDANAPRTGQFRPAPVKGGVEADHRIRKEQLPQAKCSKKTETSYVRRAIQFRASSAVYA